MPVSPSFCGVARGDALEEEPCNVECIVDCEASPFTPWSPCSQPCGINSNRTRHSTVLTPASSLGRQCAGNQHLNQVICQASLCISKMLAKVCKEEW